MMMLVTWCSRYANGILYIVIETWGKHEIGFVYLFVEMLLGVLRCIDFTMSLSKSQMWHVFIGWCKPRDLHPVLIEFNLIILYVYIYIYIYSPFV